MNHTVCAAGEYESKAAEAHADRESRTIRATLTDAFAARGGSGGIGVIAVDLLRALAIRLGEAQYKEE